jgi:hypothetical protein
MIQICLRHVEYVVLTTMFMNTSVFWYVTSSSPFKINIHFGKTNPVCSSETLVASNGLHDVISQTLEIFMFNSYHDILGLLWIPSTQLFFIFHYSSLFYLSQHVSVLLTIIRWYIYNFTKIIEHTTDPLFLVFLNMRCSYARCFLIWWIF